jgi:hypothetical protein
MGTSLSVALQGSRQKFSIYKSLATFPFQWPIENNIQGLQKMRLVGWQENEAYLVCIAKAKHVLMHVRGKVISNYYFVALQILAKWQQKSL